MSLTLGRHPALLLAALVLAGLLAWWAYRRTTPFLPVPVRAALAALRFTALGIVLALLAEPLLRRVTGVVEPPAIALLLDTSRSMDLPPFEESAGGPGGAAVPGGAAPAREAYDALRSALPGVRWLPYRFGQFAEPLDPGLPSDSIRFDGPRTDIARALEALRGERSLVAAVLVSDGRFNTGRNPALSADRLPVPVFTVTVGDTARHRDLVVGTVVTNELAYRGARLPFEAGIRHAGFGGAPVAVTLWRGGEILDRVRLELPADDGETPVTLTTTPGEAGLHRYTVAVTRLGGERTHRNNAVSVSVRVLESRKQVLLVAGAPSPDVSAIRRILDSDHDLEVTSRVRQSAATYHGGPLPDAAAYDLIVLVGFPGPGSPPADVARIADAATQGTPLLFLLDRSTDQRALAALGAAVPFRPRAVRAGFTEAAFVPTAAGRGHPVLRPANPGAPDPFGLLPPVLVSDSDFAPTADSEILATPRIRGIQLPDPILIVRRRAGARSAAVLASGFWRWQNLPEGLSGAEGVWADLVDGLVRWLSAPEDDRPVRVSPTRRTFDGSEPVRFTGQVYDESAAPVVDAAVEVEVTFPDGRVLPIALEPMGNGRYAGEAGQLPDGDYAYRAAARAAGVDLGEDRGSFSVEQLSIEYRDTRADALLMSAIAVRSGGSAVDPDGLADELASRDLLRERVVQQESVVRLWQRAPFLIAVLVLLTAEWLLRKRRGLV